MLLVDGHLAGGNRLVILSQAGLVGVIARNMGVALGVDVTDLGQGVHIAVVLGEGTPSIQDGVIMDAAVGGAVGVGLNGALAHVDTDGVHSAVQEDGIGISGPVHQGVVLGADGGDEHVVLLSLDLLQADQVAIG